jgi:hypothetical protein
MAARGVVRVPHGSPDAAWRSGYDRSGRLAFPMSARGTAGIWCRRSGAQRIGRKAASPLLRPPQEEQGISSDGRLSPELELYVRTRDSLLQGVATTARSPDEGSAVGRDERRPRVDLRGVRVLFGQHRVMGGSREEVRETTRLNGATSSAASCIAERPERSGH